MTVSYKEEMNTLSCHHQGQACRTFAVQREGTQIQIGNGKTAQGDIFSEHPQRTKKWHTAAAEIALAPKVKASTRYSWIGRLSRE
jgi:hypothetical protein